MYGKKGRKEGKGIEKEGNTDISFWGVGVSYLRGWNRSDFSVFRRSVSRSLELTQSVVKCQSLSVHAPISILMCGI